MKLRTFSMLVLVLALPLLAVNARADQLATAANFAVLAGSTATNTGPTVITGGLGVSPGSAVTGFPPGIVHGDIHAADAVALQAKTDLVTAYNYYAGLTPTQNLTGVDLGFYNSLNPLGAGVYKFNTSAGLTGTLKLSDGGVAGSLFDFIIGSTLTTASASLVDVSGLSPLDSIFWVVGSSATLGSTTSFEGNILAKTSITLVTGATIGCGRALAENGAVTMDSNIISIGCGNTTATTGGGFNGGGGTTVNIPEPGTLALLSFGLLGMVFLAFRKSRVTAAKFALI